VLDAGVVLHDPHLLQCFLVLQCANCPSRPARALPYELDARATVRASNGTVGLTFVNTGSAAAVFQVRSGNPADTVRNYTVGSSKFLGDSWNIAASSYSLSVYGPNGFVRYFKGIIASGARLSIFSRNMEATVAAQSSGSLPMLFPFQS